MTEAVATGRIEAPGYFSDPLMRWAYIGAGISFLALCVLRSAMVIAIVCGSVPSDGLQPIERKLKPTPLPATILQIDLKPSTDTLSKASKWSQDSEAILRGETTR